MMNGVTKVSGNEKKLS